MSARLALTHALPASRRGRAPRAARSGRARACSPRRCVGVQHVNDSAQRAARGGDRGRARAARSGTVRPASRRACRRRCGRRRPSAPDRRRTLGRHPARRRGSRPARRRAPGPVRHDRQPEALPAPPPPRRTNGRPSPGPAPGAMTGPSFSATVSSARSRRVRVRTTTAPPWTLWRTAFSGGWPTRRSSRRRSPRTPAAWRSQRTPRRAAGPRRACRRRPAARPAPGRRARHRPPTPSPRARVSSPAGRGPRSGRPPARPRGIAAVGPPAPRGRRACTSSSVRMTVSGRRSSWLASARKPGAAAASASPEPLEHRVEGVGEVPQLVAWAGRRPTSAARRVAAARRPSRSVGDLAQRPQQPVRRRPSPGRP